MSGRPDKPNDPKRSPGGPPVSEEIKDLSRELLAAAQAGGSADVPQDEAASTDSPFLTLEGAIQVDLGSDPQIPVARVDGPASVILQGDHAIDLRAEGAPASSMRLVVDGTGITEVVIDLAKENEQWRVDVEPHRSPLLNAEDLAYRATHDLLTGLANRASLLERMRFALERAERTESAVALLYLDVDRFKRINDSLGHHIGDAVLQELAERLRQASRPMDMVARLGGDEFVILCEDVHEARDAAVIAERILENINEPVIVGDDDVELAVGASIGIALERNVIDLDGYIRRADQALLRAKELGRSRFEFYDATESEETIKRLELEHQLRDAVTSESGLRLEYQPILTTATRSVEAVEALVRWDHPVLGTMRADEFIPLAEESGLIVPLGRWVLAEACRQLAEWDRTRTHEPELRLHINVSDVQLLDQRFGQIVAEELVRQSLSPRRIVLEVDESVLGSSQHRDVDSAITRLIELGVDFAVDHYGRGYGSVSNLGRLPVPAVKIDRAFVKGIDESARARAVLRALLDLAAAYDLRTIVEGVESFKQYQVLELLGCDAVQGFLLGGPMPAEDVHRLFTTTTRDMA